MLVYNIIQVILLSLLGLATLYIFIFSIAGLFYKEKAFVKADQYRKIAVLIPGYKEDEVIVEVAKSALQQKYPMGHFDVVVIADSFQADTLAALRKLPVRLIEVSFDKSTKSKALHKGMAALTSSYDIAVILDADNIMAADFLMKINAAFSAGAFAVQGHRTAKNQNTSWAVLDAASEEINNHIFRKGHRVLGLSSAIIGSGMAFKYDFFKTMIADVKAVGGFDKEIELKMLKEKYRISYQDDAMIYDEKVQKAEVFSNQRRRWLSAQLHYFRKDIIPALGHLVTKGNLDYFDKAIQFIQPPRVLLIGALLLLSTIFISGNYFLNNGLNYSTAWLIITMVCILAILLSVPRSFYTKKTGLALISLPRGMLAMLKSLLKIKGANKTFIHTKHTSVPDRATLEKSLR
ncbi:MAG TPA: glycosyltransferase family 2 protein [Chitinophagaceae bacterium]|nr:glycosyltransferase family 2 protein [Chitinophagaceae bacterium]